MAFGKFTDFYFTIPTDAGTSLWGTDVRKMTSAAYATGTADNTTAFNYGTTGGQVSRLTADPYSTSGGELDQAAYGWAIAPADMGSTSSSKRGFAAGVHSLTCRMSHSALTGDPITCVLYAYKVSSAATGRVRTLLGSGSATSNLGAAAQSATITGTASIPAVTFDQDETIQWSMRFECTGVSLTGRTVGLWCGTQAAGVPSKITTPPLLSISEGEGVASGSCSVQGISGKVLGTTGTSSGSCSVSGLASSVASSSGQALGSGLADGVGGAVIGSNGTASGSSDAQGAGGAVIGSTGTVVIGSGQAAPTIRPIFVVEDA